MHSSLGGTDSTYPRTEPAAHSVPKSCARPTGVMEFDVESAATQNSHEHDDGPLPGD